MSKNTDPRRIAVWLAMADHFLNTETRDGIPLTAMRCLDAGLSVAEARDIWRYEVSPAVWTNLWSVAGEWAGWNEEWLVETIERLRSRGSSRPGRLQALRYRIRAHWVHSVWCSIERFMEVLQRVESPEARELMSRDLASRARHYFDRGADDCWSTGEGSLERLGSLYPDPFRRSMAPALIPDESPLADRRIRIALGRR